MAITNNGMRFSIPAKQIPAGFTPQSVTPFNDQEYNTVNKVYSVLKSTVEDADPATTMTNIESALLTLIDEDISADFIATQTVTHYSDFIKFTNNHVALTSTDDWLTNTAVSYLCTVVTYVKSKA